MGQGGRCAFIDRHREAGGYLYVEEEPAEVVWFVKRGQVLLTRAVDSTEVVRTVRSTGEFLGLEALVHPTYIDSARVISAATVCGVARQHFDAWLGPPGTPARVALEQAVRATVHEVPRAAPPDGSALRRVARWLLTQTEAEKEKASAGVARRDIASLLGMVPETLSRVLARLARSGAVEVTRRTIKVCDRAALETAARRAA